MKRCPNCKFEKDDNEYDQYYDSNRQAYRKQPYCRLCQPEINRLRAKKYYQDNKQRRLHYAKQYRENHKDINTNKGKYRRKYIDELAPSYVREKLKEDNGVPTELSRANPELVEAKRNQLLLKRVIKKLKDEK